MGKHYDEALIPDEVRRDFDVYDRIGKLGIDLGAFEQNVTSLAGNKLAQAVVQESGLVFLSGASGGIYPMNDDEERIKHGQQGAQDVADTLITRLHWTLSCGGEGDLNDVLYTVKALGMVVSPGGGASSSAPSGLRGRPVPSGCGWSVAGVPGGPGWGWGVLVALGSWVSLVAPLDFGPADSRRASRGAVLPRS